MKRNLLGLLLVGFSFISLHATNYTSNGSGNWNTASNWSPSGVPGAGDNVTISTGDAITLNGNVFCNNITITGSQSCLLCLCGCPNSQLSLGSYTLNVAGNFTNNATFLANTGNVNFNGTGTQSIGGSGGLTFYQLTVNKASGTVSLAANVSVTNLLTMSAGIFDIGTFTLNGAGGLTATGGEMQMAKLATTLPELAGSYNLSGGTMTYNGTGAQTVRLVTFYNLDFEGSGTKSLSGTTTVGGDLTIGSGPTLDVTASNYNINLNGNWSNSGTFTQRNGTVIFNGTGAQAISGSTATTFYNLTVNKTSGTLSLNKTATVSNQLTLTNGAFYLNAKTLVISNSVSTAVSRTNGYLVSEDNSLTGSKASNNSKLQWNTGVSTGAYTIPFGTSAGVYIPVTVNNTAGSMGNLTVSTYSTAPNNTPLPIPVANVLNVSLTDNSVNTVDRFWEFSTTGGGHTVNITFTYADAEIPSNGELGNDGTGLRAQRWNGTYWPSPQAGQVFTAATNTVTLSGVTTFDGAWALALREAPLPVTLLYFKGNVNNGGALLEWGTATEINNDHYEIEKSADGINFYSIGQVRSCKNTALCNYQFRDPGKLSPLQYYRLKQMDQDGGHDYSHVISLRGPGQKMNITLKNDHLTLDLSDYMHKQVRIELYDARGVLMFNAEHVPTSDNTEVEILLPAPHALTILKIYTPDNVLTEKVMF